MNRDGFSLLAMGFTGKNALEWKLKYIQAFNEMEKQLASSKPVSKLGILVEAVHACKEHEERLHQISTAHTEGKKEVPKI